jgi:hypothetical protein
MSERSVLLALTAAALMVVPAGVASEPTMPAPAEETRRQTPATVALRADQIPPGAQGRAPSEPTAPRYVPQPSFGSSAPETRLGGGTRSGERRHAIQVLAPPSTGATVHGQPTLYWYLPRAVSEALEIVVIDAEAIDPLLELRIPDGLSEGIHGVSLAEHGVELLPGREYEWSVSIIHDPDRRATDSFAAATIVRIPSSPRLAAGLDAASTEARPRLYAEAGLWYDAIDAVHRLLSEGSSAPGLEGERRALLEQARLPGVAAPG